MYCCLICGNAHGDIARRNTIGEIQELTCFKCYIKVGAMYWGHMWDKYIEREREKQNDVSD